jgi:hypothetical protein
MVDTITLRIHDFKRKYPATYEQFYLHWKKKKSQTVVGLLADGTARTSTRGVFFSENSRWMPLSFTGSHYVASSAYNIHLYFSTERDGEPSLEMTFSIPKYLWGTNLFQLVCENPMNSEWAYAQLMRVIKKFVNDTFHEKIAFSDIEVARIDFCFNQYFANKLQAKEYQMAQKKHVRSWAISRNTQMKEYEDTNWMIETERYSFKCYHKGEEFAKGDAKKLRSSKRNPKQYDVARLQRDADRILRYEVTYRNAQIHYLTSYTLFGNTGEKRDGFVRLMSIWNCIKDLSRQGVRFSDHGSYKSRLLKDYFMETIHHYFLASPYDLRPANKLILVNPIASFEYGVYRILFDNFWKKVREVQIDSRSNVVEAVGKLERYAARKAHRKKMKVVPLTKDKNINTGGFHRSRLLMPTILSQFMDIKELKRYMKHSAYYQLMRDLKAAGISNILHQQQLVSPSLDYHEYTAGLRNLINERV